MSSISIKWKDPKEIPNKYCKLVLTINQDWSPTPMILWGVYNMWNPLERKFCLSLSNTEPFGVPQAIPEYCHVLAWDYDPTSLVSIFDDAYRGEGFEK